MAEQTLPRYRSGWCGTQSHERCLGRYAGATCSCGCHRAPAEPHRIEHTVLVYLELSDNGTEWEVAQSTIDGHPLDSPDGQPTRRMCDCADKTACAAALAAASDIPNPTGQQLAVMIRDTWRHPRYEEACDG